MLVLICGDTHLTGKNPIARLDDIVEVQFEKLEEIVMLSNKYDVPIIHTGDIFNVSIIANSILTQIGSILENLNNPLYFVWGNHDLLYHSLDLWDRTSLGIMWANSNKIKHISDFYTDYKEHWAWNDWGSEHGIQWYGTRPNILLTHKAVVTERKMGKNSWILEDEDFCMNIDKDPNLKSYKLIICGHWHKPYIFKHKNTLVINPGPVLRRTVEEWLMPSVILLNTDTLLYKRIYLKAKPPEKVLSRKHIEQRVESYTEGVMKFIEQLEYIKVEGKKKALFLESLFELLDSHQLPKNVEKILRNIIATLIEKGVINESV
jgi:DNA repair exonuclease SbcCD nuclease subunit